MARQIYIKGTIASDWWGSIDQQKNEIFYAANEDLGIYIDSPGGSVLEGLALAALISNHKAMYPTAKVETTVLGCCASIATMPLFAGGTVRMDVNSVLMIHEASTHTEGRAKELMQDAKALQTFNTVMLDRYLSQIEKNGKLVDNSKDKTKKMLQTMMDAETWFTAQQALDLGLIDQIANQPAEIATMGSITVPDSNTVLSSQATALYKNAPDQIKKTFTSQSKTIEPKMDTNEIEKIVNKAVEKQSDGFWAKLKKLFVAEDTASDAQDVTPATTPVTEVTPTAPVAPVTVELTYEQMIEKLTAKGHKIEAPKVEETAEAKAKRLDAQLAAANAQALVLQKQINDEKLKAGAKTPIVHTEAKQEKPKTGSLAYFEALAQKIA